MDSGGAYGGGKAGAPFDPIAFIQRPQVIIRALCLVRINCIDIFSIVLLTEELMFFDPTEMGM